MHCGWGRVGRGLGRGRGMGGECFIQRLPHLIRVGEMGVHLARFFLFSFSLIY